MKALLTPLLLASLLAVPIQAAELHILGYHDVRDDLLERPYALTITTESLTQQLAWLKDQGFHFISIDDVLAAKRGERSLPKKAVLLTFDDCYRSHYTHVFPLLKAFAAPAVMACVGSWLAPEEGEMVRYGDETVPRSLFLSPAQIREMADSGLVEFASHTYDLHYGLRANPQGNSQPAVVSAAFDPAQQRYESAAQQVERVEQDLLKSTEDLARLTGRRPRVMVWPYGAYNEPAIEAARKAGMPITLSMDRPVRRLDEAQLDRLGRVMILHNPTLADFALEFDERTPPFIRAVQVDLDRVYDPDPKQQEANLGALIERVRLLGVNTVYLQAFADPDGDGAADALYFPNRHLPVRADLFNRALWQLRTRAGVKRIYAWMPVSAYLLPEGHPAREAWVESEGPARGPGANLARLSIFDPRVRQTLMEVFDDLARHAPLDGVLFHDDGLLGDNEDFSPAARAALRAQGLPDRLEALRADPQLAQRWLAFKTQALIDWTLELMRPVRYWRPGARTARNLFATPVLQPDAQAWYAQSLAAFLGAYDEVVLMAMPLMEGAARPELWLNELVLAVHATPDALKKTVFELQAFDWRTQRPIPSQDLARQLQRLQLQGVLNLGYYPDDFLKDQPQASDIVPAISARGEPSSR